MLSRCSAIGARRARLDASRISFSSSAFRASSCVRSRSRARSSAGCALPKLLRQMSPLASRRKPSNATATIERPRMRAFFRAMLYACAPRAESCAARSGVASELFGASDHRLPREQLAQCGSAARALELARRTCAVGAPLAERMLHLPVLTRVVGDDDEHATGLQPVAQRRQRSLEARQLIVDRNPDPLEDPGEVARPGARAKRAANSPDEVVAGDEWAVASSTHDLASHPSGTWLVREIPQHPLELILVGFVEQVGCIHACIVAHAHVERRSLAKGKAAIGAVDLVRRDAKVDENSVEANAVERADEIQIGIIAQERPKAPRLLP